MTHLHARKRSFALCCPAGELTERAHFDGREMRRMTYGELFQLRYGESLAEYVKEIGL
jgi:hypothetical protein